MTTTDTQPLPSATRVERATDATRHAFSPTSSMRFVASGGPGMPDFYEETAARGDGPPLHRHPWPSWELVLEGEIRVVADGDEHLLGAGDAIFLPGGVPHTYVVESASARTVGINMSDGRFESLQRRAAPLLLADGGPDMESVGALATEVGVEILGPPLGAPTG